MRIGSLFSGYGGLDQAVAEYTGATTAWVSDIDKGACKVLAHRYPDAPNIGDITTVDWTAVEPVDILTGGFPCQDVSHAGKRAGIRPGTRSGLWTQMAYAIDQLQPKLVVIENVRGLLSAAAHSDVEPCPICLGNRSGIHLRALGAVLGDLADLGYDAQWHGLRAADIGAPHGRFRIFVIATDARRGGRLEAIEHDGRGTPAHDRASVPDESDRDAGRPRPEREVTLLPTPRATDGTKHSAGSTSPAAHGQISGDYRKKMDEALTDFGQYAPAIARWEQVTGLTAPAPTEPTGRDGAHRLSAPFVEWMMGLPEGWVTDVPGITRNEALKALGNGVVPLQALAAFRRLLG